MKPAVTAEITDTELDGLFGPVPAAAATDPEAWRPVLATLTEAEADRAGIPHHLRGLSAPRPVDAEALPERVTRARGLGLARHLTEGDDADDFAVARELAEASPGRGRYLAAVVGSPEVAAWQARAMELHFWLGVDDPAGCLEAIREIPATPEVLAVPAVAKMLADLTELCEARIASRRALRAVLRA